MRRFIVDTRPPQYFAFADRIPATPFVETPMKTEPVEDVRVRTFFADDVHGFELLGRISSLIDTVHMETAFDPVRINVGRFTFLELRALMSIEARQPAGMTRLPLRESEESGVFEFRGVLLVLSPGEEHHVEAVPCEEWFYSKAYRRFILDRFGRIVEG